MSGDKIREARRLAREFIKLADLVMASELLIVSTTGERWKRIDSSPLTGALRRRSMDLTRALADMRRPA